MCRDLTGDEVPDDDADGTAVLHHHVEHLGSVVELDRAGIDLAGQRLTVLLPAGARVPAAGATVSLTWKPGDLHLMEDGA